jgi:hypothetical protein
LLHEFGNVPPPELTEYLIERNRTAFAQSAGDLEPLHRATRQETNP